MKIKALRTFAASAALTGLFVSSAFATSIGGATVDASAINLRTEASTSSSILTTAPRGSVVVAAAKTNDNWYKVVYRGAVGYMSTDFLAFSETLDGSFGTGNIFGSSVRMRSEADLSSSILGTYDNGTQMTILGVSGSWYKVQYNDKVGYVYSDYFALNGGYSELYSGSVADTIASGAYSVGQTIVDTAKQFLGVPYVWAGTSPSGFDCSGLVYYVYKQCGYSINRTAASIYENGVLIEKSDLQVGDAICFSNSSSARIGHVGIYIGDGQFIHASSSTGCVIISELNSDYFTNHYIGARRII